MTHEEYLAAALLDAINDGLVTELDRDKRVGVKLTSSDVRRFIDHHLVDGSWTVSYPL